MQAGPGTLTDDVVTRDPVDGSGDFMLISYFWRYEVSVCLTRISYNHNLPVWRLSRTRRTSAVLRPVLAGYERMRRMVFLGSMMKTERMVNAIPLLSTLVASWWSILAILSVVSQMSRNLSYSHVVCQRDLTVLVANDGELQLTAGDFVNVLDPTIVGVDGVGGETDELGTTTGELRLQLGESTELSCTDRGVILWVREEDDPVVADELVEVDRALSGLGLEVRGLAAEAERLWSVAHCVLRSCQVVSKQTAQTCGVAG